MKLETDSYEAEITLERRDDECLEIWDGEGLMGHIALIENSDVDYLDDGKLQIYFPQSTNEQKEDRLEATSPYGVKEKEPEENSIEEVRQIFEEHSHGDVEEVREDIDGDYRVLLQEKAQLDVLVAEALYDAGYIVCANGATPSVYVREVEA